MSSGEVRARTRWRSRTSLSALVCFCLVSFLYFGLRLLIEPGRQYVGFGVDPQLFIWSFAWWPHALLHGQNPFYTHAIWAPSGVNLAWTTSVPGLALLFAPLTLVAGPVAAYNVAAVLIPAVTAWTAFLLCRHLTGSFWPSLAGGYLFGFSSYVLGQEEGHPHMTSVFLVPLVALAVIRYVDGELDARATMWRLGLLFAFQVLLSTELAFTLAIAVSAGLALGAAFFPGARRRIVSLVPALGAAAALAALLLAPFLYFAVTGYVSETFNPPRLYTTDPLNLVVPTKLALASFDRTLSLAARFPGNDSEQDAYVGLPALLILALYARCCRRSPGARFLVSAIALAVFLSLGDALHVAGSRIVSLPWRLVVNAPIFDNVLPSRLVMFASLALAVVVAAWASARRPGPLRWALPAIAVIAIAPNPASGAWATTFHVPPFFTSSLYRSCLHRDETVLPFPVSGLGDEMLWQAEDGFRFRMAGGHIAPAPPRSFTTSAEAASIANGDGVPPDQAGLLRAFAGEKGVTSAIVSPGDAGKWSYALSRIAPVHSVGGVLLFHLDGSSPPCAGA